MRREDGTGGCRFLGAELLGIYYLRTVAECDAIKHEAVAGRRAAVIGMGFIGCGVVASLAQLGVRSTALSRGATRWNGSWQCDLRRRRHPDLGTAAAFAVARDVRAEQGDIVDEDAWPR